MVNRFKNYIDLTKKISESGIIYCDSGFLYTFGKNQMFQAITDIRNDKKTINFGLDKKTFKINVEKFSEFEKQYKKDVVSSEIDNNDIIIKTTLSNISYIEKWLEEDNKKLNECKEFFKSLDEKIKDGTCQLLTSSAFDEEKVEYFIKAKPVKFYIGRKSGKVLFNRPKNDSKFFMISLLDSYLGKLLKSSKDVIINIYSSGEDEKILIFNLSVTNGKFITNYYGKFFDFI